MTYETQGKHVYLMEVKINDETKLEDLSDIFFNFYITEILIGERKQPENLIIALHDYNFNIQESDRTAENEQIKRVFNNKYYLLLTNKAIKPENYTYKKGPLEITFTEESNELIPYLESPKYCESKEDCVIRDNFCSYGGYNKFYPFYHVWGCATFTDDEGIVYPGKEGECTLPEYQDVECVNNSCVGKDKVCKKYL